MTETQYINELDLIFNEINTARGKDIWVMLQIPDNAVHQTNDQVDDVLRLLHRFEIRQIILARSPDTRKPLPEIKRGWSQHNGCQITIQCIQHHRFV